MGKSQRVKGANGEREVAKKFQEKGIELLRVPNSGGLQRRPEERGDLIGLTGFHVEVKRQEKASIWAWLEQAESDCLEGLVPLVIFRRNKSKWRVIVPLDDFIEMYMDANKNKNIDTH